MKFSEMTYTRPDIDGARAALQDILRRIESAESAAAQIAAVEALNVFEGHLGTMATLASIRHSIDTRDAYYDAENDFIDEHMPLLEEDVQRINRALLASPHRAALEEKYGKVFFLDLELAARSFTPEMVEPMQRENKLSSEYQKLYASAVVEFDGKQLPLPKLGPYKQSPDRATRRRAYETEAAFFDAHREQLDALYDALVKVRTEQGRMLGYENYIPLGYDRMGRNCYGPAKVAAFRAQIADALVPLVAKVKAAQEKRLGVDKLKLYDDVLLFPDGNPTPRGTADDILAAGLAMYRSMSPETAEFIEFMYDNELLDVLSKDGKAPGGYCTEIYDHRAPFIFSNFNGTAGDVDVLTHEAGHAFAAFRAMKKGYPRRLMTPTMDGAETHSMSMEFLTSPYHHLFFGDATARYEIAHAEEALTFLPYGCMVDEFQHVMYEDPTLTPEQRNAVWLELEKKYRPWMDYDALPFYGRGALWQRQLHIYLYPLYYIDYCMAQTMAFQFWTLYLRAPQEAWTRYLAFVDQGGSRTFEELVRGAGLRLPYDEGAVRAIGAEVGDWLAAHE
ncbi:MAG: M3 family oligoendopeptidase [Oscillospiraceae bacterium]|nr:M3 family oligoendopeptidase [Oscillospiraceae bacterium]